MRSFRSAVVPLVAILVGIGTCVAGARDAKASVSAAVLFEELVEEANAAAIVTPMDHHAVWEGGRIVTYTHVRVDRLVAGQLPAETWVRTLGGAVDGIGQLVEGEPAFDEGKASLVFLGAHLDPETHAPDGPFVVVERAQGQFPLLAAKDQRMHVKLASDLGVLLPPPQEHWDRAAKRLPRGTVPHYARDVLEDRSLDDAAREIATAWPRMH